METLKQMYEELLDNVNRWSYYLYPPCLTYNTLHSGDASYKFIKDYFQCAGKGAVFDNDSFIIKNKTVLKKRAPHIVSTYLLGIIIAESFNCDLNRIDKDKMNFKYLWFLACLYHDIGYAYENNHNCRYLRMLQTDGLDAVQEICDIKYMCECEFKTYKKEHINIYLSNRAICSKGKAGAIDHGIVGGLMMYDRLRKNFEQVWRKVRTCDSNSLKASFDYNGLHFSNTHYEYYAKAADAIIAHNIWSDTLNEYLKKEGKQYLEENKIDKNNEIAFVLALADTLEPIKKYGINALDMIYYEKTCVGFTLSMPNNENKDIYKYILDLPNWVAVDITEEPTYTFSIKSKE